MIYKTKATKQKGR